MVANLKSLLIPIAPAPTVDTSWLDNLTKAAGSAIDTASQNKSFGRLADQIGGAPAAAQQPSFLSRLFGGGQQQAAAQPQNPNTTSIPPVSGNVSPGQPNDIYNRFIGTVQQNGVTNPNALAAIAATGRAESSYDPSKVNAAWADPSQSGAAGTAGGIMSWRNERLANLRNYAQAQGEDPSNISPETQAKFFLQEDPSLVQKLNNAQSPQEAAGLMANAWKFAGYNQPGGEAARRQALTQNYFSTQFKDQQPPAAAAINAAAPPSGSVVAPPANAPAGQGQTQVASLDPHAGMTGAPAAAPFDPATASPTAMMQQLGLDSPAPGQAPYRDPMVTTAGQQQPMTMASQNVPGLISPGNIDLSKRPVVKNPDGSISTVRSISFNQDGKEVLVPTVSPDGRILSNDEALDLYRKTGQNLGVFDSPASADAYAQSLHNQQSSMYAPQQQSQQVAQNAPAPQGAGPQTLAPGVTTASRQNVSNDMIASMVRDPNTRQIGLQLWQQVLTGKGAQPWKFVTLDDGTLARANEQTGAVETLGQFKKPQGLENVRRGSTVYDPNTKQWITPPEGAAGAAAGKFGLQPIYGTDAVTGKTGIGQIGDDGSFHVVDTGGFQPVGNVSNANLGTSIVTRDKAGNIIGTQAIDNAGKSAEEASGKNLAANQQALPGVMAASNQLISTIDSLASDPHLDSMLGPINSRLPTLTSDGERVKSKMDQITGQTFLQAYNQLRGGGAITDIEGEKATKSLNRLNAAQNPQDYRAALNDFREIVVNAANRARTQAGQGDGSSPAPAAGAKPAGKTTSGISWSVEQ